jgi:hypothetical protein
LPALILGDGRELWTIGFDSTIKSYVDDFCLSTKDGKEDEGTSCVVVPCKNAAKWLVFKDGVSPDYTVSLINNNEMVVA